MIVFSFCPPESHGTPEMILSECHERPEANQRYIG